MRKTFLKTAQKALLTMREQLLLDIRSEQKTGRDAQKDEGMDAYDVASEERDRDIGTILSDRDRTKLQAIDAALERIRGGIYGVCEECELEIAPDRLKALPVTRLCVVCQGDREREARLTRRPDEDRGIRRLQVGETDEEG